MIDQVRDHVKSLFADGKISVFVGLLDQNGAVAPHLYQSAEELDCGFTLGETGNAVKARYPMGKVLLSALRHDAESVFGVLLRGCDERAVNELIRWNQIPNPDRVVKVGFSCEADYAASHECRKPYPDALVAGEKTPPAVNATIAEVEGKELNARLDYWLGEFDRCIKCYGCRNVCPVCFCNVCSLEDTHLIRTGDLPPENPMFHLTRAVHMAGRCIDCNLCTEACPADIPLRTLYKKVAQIVQEDFGYTTGELGEGKSPLNILGPDPGHTAAND